MATPKIYIDACCIIEAIKGRRGIALKHPAQEVEMIWPEWHYRCFTFAAHSSTCS